MSAAEELKEVKVDIEQPIREVHIDGIAVMKIVKHCDANVPNLVGGSLLGIDNDGVMEITYSFPFPATKTGDIPEGMDGGAVDTEIDGAYYQTEMMTMLRDVNVDNNCVGWYQSMYLGTVFTNDVVDFQFKYQSTEDISENSVVIMYDHIGSTQGNLVLKAYRLTDAFVQQRKAKKTNFTKPDDILEEIPIKIKNVGHVAAFTRCLQDTEADQVDCGLDPLSMLDTDTATERHLRECNNWLEDFMHEHHSLSHYAKSISKQRSEQISRTQQKERENAERKLEGDAPLPITLKPLAEAPPMTEAALMVGQLKLFAEQLNSHVSTSMRKLYTAKQFTTDDAEE